MKAYAEMHFGMRRASRRIGLEEEEGEGEAGDCANLDKDKTRS